MAGNEHVPVAARQASLHVLGQRKLPVGADRREHEIHLRFQPDRAELYDLAADPYEQHNNLSSDPTYAALMGAREAPSAGMDVVPEPVSPPPRVRSGLRPILKARPSPRGAGARVYIAGRPRHLHCLAHPPPTHSGLNSPRTCRQGRFMSDRESILEANRAFYRAFGKPRCGPDGRDVAARPAYRLDPSRMEPAYRMGPDRSEQLGADLR